MTDTLRHRGPDDSGTFVEHGAGVGLGNRRLAVVDLSANGHQPMTSSDERFVCTYNGEIYNFMDLRAELEAARSSFPGRLGHRDLLSAVQQWGVFEAIKRCNGMFALALWDRQDRTLSLARDRFGEKPLYYGWAGNTFLFGSELKALRAHPAFDPEIDRDVARAVLPPQLCARARSPSTRAWPSSCPGTVSHGEGVHCAGNHARTGSVLVAALRSPTPPPPPRSHGPPTKPSASSTGCCPTRCASGCMRTSRLGALISGGIDSSIVTALMQAQSSSKVRTFTIAFDDAAYDESADARRVANHLGTEHQELVVTASDALGVIPSLPQMFDEPFADSSQIPTAMLASLTRQHVTVALAGDGGDELFGGYNRYAWAEHFWNRVAKVPRPARRVVGDVARRRTGTVMGPGVPDGGTGPARPAAGEEPRHQTAQGGDRSPRRRSGRDLRGVVIAFRRSRRARARRGTNPPPCCDDRETGRRPTRWS